MSTPEEYFDINAEPSRFKGRFEADQSEQTVPAIDGHEDEISTIRDSVMNEPAFTGRLEQTELTAWLAVKRAQCTLAGNVWVTLAAALIAGPFAVVGAFTTGQQTAFRMLYMVLFAPIIEELLKQSGMIYLLEKKPYRIFSSTQFIAAAVISSVVFATIENLLYLNFYTNPESMENFADFCAFRWAVCTALHVICSIIASFGLVKVWKKQLADGRAADLAGGFKFFLVAIIIHGLYNLSTVMINPGF